MPGGGPERRLRSVPGAAPPPLDELLLATARGDETALAQVYDALSPAVYGLARRVVRDPARAEEVTQDVFLSVWRFATRFDPAKGSARTWVLTLTHRRAVDVVRADAAASRREQQVAAYDTPFDTVLEEAATRIQGEQVRNCLDTLTDLQRESVLLAYYGGYTYREVSMLLDARLPTVKTRMRDGLIRLRDCLGAWR
jgi:RNA polymerase sigma-70 factor (ECF subfamily)